MDETTSEVPPNSNTDEPGTAVARAAALGPLPGIHDDPEATGDSPQEGDASSPSADDDAVGTTAGDEAESVIGFRGLRS